MKKLIFLISFILLFFVGLCQPKVVRTTPANTIYDTRHGAILNEVIPVFLDTLAANAQIGIDSCGAVFYSYSTKTIWYRQCSPHKWVELANSGGGGTITNLINGLTLSGTTGLLGGNLTQNTLISGGTTFGVDFQNMNGFNVYSDAGTTTRLKITGVSSRLMSPNGANGIKLQDDTLYTSGLGISNDTAGRKIMTINPITGAQAYANWIGSGGGGSTPLTQNQIGFGSAANAVTSSPDFLFFNRTDPSTNALGMLRINAPGNLNPEVTIRTTDGDQGFVRWEQVLTYVGSASSPAVGLMLRDSADNTFAQFYFGHSSNAFAPSQLLVNVNAGIGLVSSAGYVSIGRSAVIGSSETARFTLAGRVGINNSTPGQRLSVSGSFSNTDSVITTGIGRLTDTTGYDIDFISRGTGNHLKMYPGVLLSYVPVPSWESVMVAGSNLTTDHTVTMSNGGGVSLTFSNFLNFNVQTNNGTGTIHMNAAIYDIDGLPALTGSTGDRIIGQTAASGNTGYFTIGTGLSVVSGALTATATGTVTSVGFTGGLISVANPTTTPAFTVAGTSGGIPYFSSTSTWASSALLAANALMIGGGAGTAPSTTTTGAGVLTFLGTPSWTNFNSMITGTAPFWSLASGGTLTGTNTITAGSNPLILSTGVTTGTGATAGFQIAANSLTSGNGVDVSSSSITSGNLLALTSTSTAGNAFSLLNINSSGANANASRTATGLKLSVTNSGTTNTNIGADITATGGATSTIALKVTGTTGSSSSFAALFTGRIASGGQTTPFADIDNGNGSLATGSIIVTTASGTNQTGNFSTGAQGLVASNVGSIYQFLSSSTVNAHVYAGGTGATAVGVGLPAASLIIGASMLPEAASGNHPLLAGLVVLPPTITGAAATVTNAATVYIDAPTAATVSGGNYSLLIGSGASSFGGSMKNAYRTTSTNINISATTDHFIEVTSSTPTLTLPDATGITGTNYVLINSGAGTAVIATTSSQVIGNSGSATTLNLTAGTSINVVSTGTAWRLW